MKTVTFVLNTWQRPHTLKDQIDAIEAQTVKPNELMIWQNKPSDIKKAFYIQDDTGSVKISHNNYN